MTHNETRKLELATFFGSDQEIADSARISFGLDNDGKPINNLINYLMEHEHSSPFEMAELKVKVTCPIYVARQWMRHRTFSYNEISLRYTEADQDNYFMPETLRIQSSTNKQSSEGVVDNQDRLQLEMEESIINSFETYEKLIASGICKEQARAVLPLATNTTFYCKGNLKNWLHFIKLRMHDTAQEEIRWFADRMCEIIKEKFPVVWDAYKKFVLDSVKFTKEEISFICSAFNGKLLTQAESGLKDRHYQKVIKILGIN